MDIFFASLLPLAVVVIMFSLGLGLTPNDFRRIIERPRAFCLGAVNQIILLPLIAYGIIMIFGFTAETAVGIMILAACPGGAVSNIVTRLARWDVALSVTLTASFSLTCVLTIPFILDFAVFRFMGSATPDFDIAATAITAFLYTALPIALGLSLRSLAPEVTAALAPLMFKIAMVLFFGVIAGAILSNWQIVADNFASLGLGLLTLIGAVSVAGYVVSRGLKTTSREAKTIAIETGVQNGALALAIAGVLGTGGAAFNAYSVPAALYGVVWLGSALPAFLLLSRGK